MRALFLTIALFLGGTAHAATQVFFEDFSSGAAPAEFSGAGTVVSAQGYAGVGTFADNLLHNDTSTPTNLSLSGLASHNSITLKFDLAIIDSWDGGGAFGPDLFNVNLDAVSILSTLMPNAVYPAGVSLTVDAIADLGFNATWFDRAFTVALTVAHTGSTADFSFFASGAGFQGSFDESWAIDNVEVLIDRTKPNVIPLPLSATLLAGGLSLFGLFGIRKKRLNAG